MVWSDGCLGVHEPDIACTTALVEGFALWLSDGDVAYRYHTDATGTVVRLAESGIPLGEVEAPPLPEGDDEPAPPPEPVPVDIPPGARSPARLRQRRPRQRHRRPGVGLGRHRGGRAERDRDGRRLPPLAPLPPSLSRPR